MALREVCSDQIRTSTSPPHPGTVPCKKERCYVEFWWLCRTFISQHREAILTARASGPWRGTPWYWGRQWWGLIISSASCLTLSPSGKSYRVGLRSNHVRLGFLFLLNCEHLRKSSHSEMRGPLAVGMVQWTRRRWRSIHREVGPKRKITEVAGSHGRKSTPNRIIP